MFLFNLRVNEDVIYKDQYKFIQVFTEDIVHHTHKIHGCIGKTKWNCYKLVVVVSRSKGYFMNIFIVDPYLKVFEPHVYL